MQAAERVIAITNDALVQGRARYYAGVSLAGMQAYDRAASYLNQAAAVAELPESAHAALKLGDVELARGKLPEAGRAYRTAAEKASQLGLRDVQLEAWYSLARLEELNGNTDEALRLYTACGILFDDSTVVPECMYRAVLLLKKMGRDSDAGELARELEKRYPDSPWTRMLRKTTAAHE
ncbi:MAG TPA: tetratricopeptide repeat protein [Lentisphaerae bacterium]|nr:tetratricopeptide repeat protein [Lentisphaerota bacterium]